MATQIKIMRKYRVKSGRLTGYIGTCYAADFSENMHGPHVLIEVDSVTSLFLHPRNVDLVDEPDELDIRQTLLGGMEA